jgi:glycosyltransferase involved in cell wall biosynthesis
MWSMWNFRKTVITELSNKYDVSVVSPYDGYEKNFTNSVQTLDWKLNGKSTNLFSEIQSILQLDSFLKDQSVQILVCYGIKPILYSSLLRVLRRSKNRYVFMFAGLGDVFTKKYLFYRFIRFIFKLIIKNATIVVLNPSDFKKIAAQNFRSCNLVQFDGEGLDLAEQINPENYQKHFDFIYVGRLLKEKGICDFLSAIIMLKNSGLQVTAKVLGDFYYPDPSFKRSIETLISKSGVEFVGFKSNPMEHIVKAKFLVFPTRYGEGLPRTVMEAMNVGVIPIVFSNPGIDHVVTDNVNGFVSYPSVAELAKKMEKVCHFTEPELNIFSSHCIKTSERFNIEKILHQYKKLIK